MDPRATEEVGSARPPTLLGTSSLTLTGALPRAPSFGRRLRRWGGASRGRGGARVARQAPDARERRLLWTLVRLSNVGSARPPTLLGTSSLTLTGASPRTPLLGRGVSWRRVRPRSFVVRAAAPARCPRTRSPSPMDPRATEMVGSARPPTLPWTSSLRLTGASPRTPSFGGRLRRRRGRWSSPRSAPRAVVRSATHGRATAGVVRPCTDKDCSARPPAP